MQSANHNMERTGGERDFQILYPMLLRSKGFIY